MSLPAKHFYAFGPYRLDAGRRLLLREEEAAALTSKGFDLLLLLVQSSGRVLEKDELMTKLWPDAIVEEGNLSVYISTLRKALGESPGQNRYIATIPGRGYRFVAEVREFWEGPTDLAALEHSGVPLVIDAEYENVKTARGEESQMANVETLARAAAFIDSRRQMKLVIIVSCVLLFALIVVGFYGWKARPSDKRVRSLAVLPFKLLNSEADEYLGVGLADVLITRLSNLKQIVVRPTSAVLKYKGQYSDPVAAGREQQVDAVLEGNIHRLGERIRVTARLIDVRDRRPLWAEQFDAKMSDIFAAEDLISQRLARAMALNLNIAERRSLVKRGTENVESHQLYLRGRVFWNKRTREGTRNALECFKRAIDLDPNFALAYVGVAECYFIEIIDLPQKERHVKMKDAAIKALEIDETLAEAHTALAWVKFYYEWDWAEAETEFKRAIELNPNYATARHWYACYLSDRGRIDEAFAEIKHALVLDPVSLIINTNMGVLFNQARLYDEAIAQLQSTIELDPAFSRAHWRLGMTYSYKGMHEPAIAELTQAVNLSGGDHDIQASLGSAYAKAGKRDEALKILRELDALCEKNVYCEHEHRAVTRAHLGEKDRAFELLRQAIEERHSFLELKVDPRYDILRSDPRFGDLIWAVGLTP